MRDPDPDISTEQDTQLILLTIKNSVYGPTSRSTRVCCYDLLHIQYHYCLNTHF